MAQSFALLPVRPPVLGALDREFGEEALASLGTGALSEVPFRLLSDALYQPLVEFFRRPGKEFRGELVTLAWQLGGRKDAPPPELALAVEVLHAGSLVVDDIEDESMERRGEPCLHRLFGVAPALNAGNWMYFWPFELLGRAGLPKETRLAAFERVGKTLRECHYGQALDLSTRLPDLERAEVLPVVRAVTELKTGSLVALAMALGALASGADERVIYAAERFGRDLGSGLQMLDDLSGVATERRRHKGVEDLRNGSPTWPWAWLSRALPEGQWEALITMERAVLDGAPTDELLAALSRHAVPLGKQRVHAFLAEALAKLSADVSRPSVTAALKRQIERLEKSYV